jgi:hypothetical protein
MGGGEGTKRIMDENVLSTDCCTMALALHICFHISQNSLISIHLDNVSLMEIKADEMLYVPQSPRGG